MEAGDLVELVGTRALLDSLPVGVTCLDARTRRIVYRNAIAQEIASRLQMPYDGLETAAHMGFLWPDGRPLAPEEIPGVASIDRGERIQGLRILAPCLDGGMLLLAMNTAPLRDAEGTIVGALLTFRQIEDSEADRHRADQRRRFEIAERRGRLLAILAESLREFDEPSKIVAIGTRILGVHLKVDRCSYCTLDTESDSLRLFDGYTSGVRSNAGTYRLSHFGERLLDRMRTGETDVIADSRTDPRSREDHERIYAPLGVQATIAVPLVRGGRWVGLFSVSQEEPRDWQPEEVRLVEEVADRLWSTIQRIEDQRALAVSEARFRALVEGIPELTWTALSDGMRDYHSPQWLAYTGREAEESLGERWLDAIHPDDRESVALAWRRSFEKAVPFDTTLRLRRNDGAYRYFRARACPVYDDDGIIVRWMGASSDIHDLLMAQRETEIRAERQSRVAESAYRITHARSIDEALRVASEDARLTLGAKAVLVRLENDGGGLANWSGSLGGGRFLWATVGARANVERTLAHVSGFQAIQVDLNDSALRQKFESLGLADIVSEPSTALVAPMLDQEGTRIGLMILCPGAEGCGSEAEAVLSQYAQLLTGAILNARLADGLVLKAAELRRASRETFDRLARAAALRDEDTADHTGRVGRLSMAIAAAMGLPREDATRLGRAAELHDVGKIGVPDAILRKPGPLTAEERTIIQTHAQLGAEILEGCEDPILRAAMEIAYCHHERWDGKGYPRGLAGESIPLVGRIVAVADAFDAMTQDRPYRRAMSIPSACEVLEEGRGTQWDPSTVDALLRHLSQSSSSGVA